MKKIFLILTFIFSVFQLNAQKAQVMLSYDYHYFDPRGIEKNDKYILLAGNECSKFYNNQSQWLDSVRCTKEGEQWYVQQGLVLMGELMSRTREEREAFMNSSAIGHPVNMYVVRDKDKFKVWDMVYSEYRKYTEPIEGPEWTVIEDSTKNIIGYECIKATGNFHGRQWNIWYAPEIPINAGPWKLQGLPGIILEAIDATGQHHFSANGIESVNMAIPPVYEPYPYEKTTRHDFLKLCRYRYDNIRGMRALHYGADAPELSPEQIEYESGKEGFDLLETDYR